MARSRKSSTWGIRSCTPRSGGRLFSQLSSRARNYLNDNSYPFVVEYVWAISKRNLARVVERLEEKAQDFLAE